jgi:hypothetical protein
MTLTYGDWKERRSLIAITPEDKNIPVLNVSLHGLSGFSSFMDNQGGLDFGVVFRNDYTPETHDILLYTSTATAIKDRVSQITTETGSAISVEKVSETNEVLKDSVGQFVLQKNFLRFSLDIKPNSKLGAHMEKIVLSLNTGEKRTITATYDVKERPVFDTERFYLINLKPSETRVFSVFYNKNAGGTPRTFRVEGVGVEVVSRETQSSSVKITLKYTAPAKFQNNATLGKMIVEAEDGRKHTLPIIAS